ncbi:hypothetical protein BC940DRAFT_229496, partial [Gongronella butleri]
DEHLLTTRLPKDLLPKHDAIAKAVLRPKNVMNAIVKELTGGPHDTYALVSTDWQNKSRSDIVY